MDMKKIIIVVIILLIIGVGAFLYISSQPKTLQYDDHFSVTIPGDFKTTEEGGLISSASPANESYVLTISEENDTNASGVETNFNVVKNAEDLSVVKDTIKDIKQYDVGNNKVYEFTTTDPAFFEAYKYDAKKVRSVSFVVPDTEKVYNIFFLTNDTSADLNTPEIASIINSTSSAKTK